MYRSYLCGCDYVNVEFLKNRLRFKTSNLFAMQGLGCRANGKMQKGKYIRWPQKVIYNRIINKFAYEFRFLVNLICQPRQ